MKYTTVIIISFAFLVFGQNGDEFQFNYLNGIPELPQDLVFSEYSRFVKSIFVVIDDEPSIRDLVDVLVKKIDNVLTVTIANQNFISKVIKVENNDTFVQTTKNLLQEMQLFVVMHKNIEDLNKSLENSVFQTRSRSFFIIFITEESPDDGSIKEIMEIIWNEYKILEVCVVISKVSSMFKFDPIYSKIVLIDQKEDSFALVHKYRNFHGYPLKVKQFKRELTVVKDMPESLLSTYFEKDIKNVGYKGGIDGFLLGNLVNALNLTAEISPPLDGIEYGWELPNGTFTGTIGEIISRSADISFNGRFIKSYGSEDIEFTYPVFHDRFCILVPKALIIPTWMNIFQGFTLTVWYVIVATSTVCGVLWWFMKSFSPSTATFSSSSLGFCLRFMDVVLLIVGHSMFLPTLGRERIFIAACLFFNMIFSGVFQGYLNTAFSTVSHYPDIDSLEELDQSGLPIATSSRLDDLFGSDPNPILTSLRNKVIKIKTAAILRTRDQRDVCAVERRNDAKLLIELYHIGPGGEPKLHLVDECPRSYHLAYIVYKGYPFLPHINDYFRRSIEAGLNEFWYELTLYSISLKHRYKNVISSGQLEKLSLVDVQTAFFALAFGLITAFVIFICEIVNAWKVRKSWKITTRDLIISPPYPFVT